MIPVPGSGRRPRGFLLAHSPANRRLLAEMLSAEGLDVLEAGELSKAEKIVHDDEHDGETLKVAVIDVGGFSSDVFSLCEGLSGQEVPVVVITSGRTEQIQEASLRAGVHSVLEKPLRKANLKALLGSLLEDR